MKVGKGSCNGTFGELVQGVLGERPFLVTLPIPSLKSEATFIPNPDSPEIVGPVGKLKAVTACKKLLKFFDQNCGGTLSIESNIPEGKGMASSSTDIVASLRAVADSFDLKITEEIISEIAIGIEPTDGVMYEGVVAYDYINGHLIERCGVMLDFSIIGIDYGNTVDTVQFNQMPKDYTQDDRKSFVEAYELLKMGLEKRDFSLICRATTTSARINQRILPKPLFKEFEDLAKRYNVGVVVAHSGTVIGLIVNHQNQDLYNIVRQVSKRFSYHLIHLNQNTIVHI